MTYSHIVSNTQFSKASEHLLHSGRLQNARGAWRRAGGARVSHSCMRAILAYYKHNQRKPKAWRLAPGSRAVRECGSRVETSKLRVNDRILPVQAYHMYVTSYERWSDGYTVSSRVYLRGFHLY